MANALPYYDLADIQRMVADGNWEFANVLAEKKFEECGWTEEKLIQFITCLRASGMASNGDFHKQFPAQSIYKGNNLVDADAYKMRFDEESLGRGNTTDCCFFIKLAILSDEDGSYVGVTSFHLDT